MVSVHSVGFLLESADILYTRLQKRRDVESLKAQTGSDIADDADADNDNFTPHHNELP